MTEYHFKLIAKSGPSDDITEAIYGQCDDATISYREGIIRIIFDREAESLESAISSAVADVLSVTDLVIDHIEMPADPAVKVG